VLVTWNLAALRGWYINIHDSDQNLILCRALVSSPARRALAPRPSKFVVASMTWDSIDGGRIYFVMTDPAPSSIRLGTTINVSGALNDGTAGDGAVNGVFVIDQYTDPTHFSALVSAASGDIGTITGDVVINIATYALIWNRGIVTAVTSDDHGFPLGSIVRLSIDDVTPSGYNEIYYCVISGPREFRFQLVADPGGPATRPGTYAQDINLVDGYFTKSSLVYRESAKQFEVRP
jgi:hypothetical protein